MDSLRWYHSTWFIALLFAFWFLIIPLIIGCILLSKQKMITKALSQEWEANKLQEINNYQHHLLEEFESKKTQLTFKETELSNRINRFDDEKILEHKRIAKLTLLSQLKILAFQKAALGEITLKEDKLQNRIKNFEQEQEREKALLLHEKKQLGSEITSLERKVQRKHHQLNRLKRFQHQLMHQIIVLKDEILYQSFGFYDLKYDLQDSQEYKEALDKIQQKQKESVKYELATNQNYNWGLDNIILKGEAMNKRNIKMIIRSFNNECDAIIHKVKFHNVEASEKKIRMARGQLNKLNQYNLIEITDYYLDLKLEELYLAYEYEKKKKEEKEEQRRIKELMREERRAQEELEEKLKIIKKEEQHFLNVLHTYRRQMANVEEDLRHDLKKEIEKNQAKLKELQNEKAKIDYRVHHAKAGYVYVISNLGSFGENMYKIGMTRRLEPLDRVKELGDASVPFPFDIHAMIFSDDAPSLEHSLHKTFSDYRVNKVNNRKEFFHVSLDEIEKVVREKHNAVVEFTKLAEAQEYRETMAIEKSQSKRVIVIPKKISING